MSEQRKMTYEELEKAAGELAARVIWALKFCRSRGGGQVLVNEREVLDDGSVRLVGDMETKWWQDYFMDALDMVGHRVDREKFYEQGRSKKARTKAS